MDNVLIHLLQFLYKNNFLYKSANSQYFAGVKGLPFRDEYKSANQKENTHLSKYKN